MAFTPNGQSLPNRFVKNNNSGGNNRAIDRLATVEGYDLNNSTIKVVDDQGRHLHVSMSKDAYQRGQDILAKSQKAREAKFFGMVINDRMQNSIPEGSRVILKQVKITRSTKESGETVLIGECNNVHNVTEPSPEKTFEALYTVRMYDNAVNNVQVWNEDVIAHNGSDESNERLQALCEKFDEYKERREEGEYLPNLGFQFRVLIPSPDKEGEYQVIDMTPPLDYHPGEKDDEGNVLREGQVVDSEWFADVLNQYCQDHVDVKYPKEDYPGLKIEVLTYADYRATENSRNASVQPHWSEKHPLNMLGKSQTRLSFDDGDEDVVVGKNYAVRGIIELTGDKADKETREFITTNLIKGLHYGGTIGHLHAFIRSADEKKVEPHPNLRALNRKKSNDVAPANNDGQDQSQAQDQSAGFDNDDGSDVPDPFANDGDDTPFNQEEKPARSKPSFGAGR